MSISFVTFTDSHIKVKTPQSRTDTDWLNVCLGQVERVFALANSRRAHAVLCSGDVGHSPTWSDTAISGLYDILNEYKHIPFITTIGQHDTRGHRAEAWEQSSLGLLSKLSGLVKVLEGGRSISINRQIEVYGFGFNQTATDDLLQGVFEFPMNNKFKIALVHASVGAQETMGWKAISNQTICGCDVASFGDIHDGFDVYEFPSKAVAYSTGSLVRTSLSDRGRVPFASVITVEDDGKYEIEFVPMSDGDDAVVFFTNEMAQAAGDTAQEFKSMVQKAREQQGETAVKRVRRVGAASDFTERQINLVVDRLDHEEE